MSGADHYQKPLYLPRGVSDPQGLAGYIANAADGIDAINLLTGDLLWETDTASKPLIVYRNRLAALRRIKGRKDLLQIVVLDLDAKGSLILASVPVALPDWVSAAGNDDTFALEVHLDRGALMLDWEAHLRYRGGAPPPDQVLSQHTKDAGGVVRVDLESGQVQVLSVDTDNMARQEELMVRQMSDPSTTRIWKIDDGIAALIWRVSDGKLAFYLKYWNRFTKRFSDEIKLIEGEAIVPQVTPDGLYLFFNQERPSKSAGEHNSTWQVFSAETGRHLADLTYEQGAQQPCVVAPNLYYLVERQKGSVIMRTLKARELASDKQLWERLLQERSISKPPALRL